MKTQLLLILTMAFAAIVYCDRTHAERMAEQPTDATHVVTGTVRCVFTRDTATQTQYIIKLKVTGIERPASIAPGDVLQVYCFQSKKAEVAAGATLQQRLEAQLRAAGDERGHTSVPAEGQQVRILTKYRRGRLEGIYPDWFTLVKSASKPNLNQADPRK